MSERLEELRLRDGLGGPGVEYQLDVLASGGGRADNHGQAGRGRFKRTADGDSDVGGHGRLAGLGGLAHKQVNDQRAGCGQVRAGDGSEDRFLSGKRVRGARDRSGSKQVGPVNLRHWGSTPVPREGSYGPHGEVGGAKAH